MSYEGGKVSIWDYQEKVSALHVCSFPMIVNAVNIKLVKLTCTLCGRKL